MNVTGGSVSTSGLAFCTYSFNSSKNKQTIHVSFRLTRQLFFFLNINISPIFDDP